MGRYSDNLKLNAILNLENENDKIESLKEVLNLLSATDDGTTKLMDVINAAIDAKITAAIGEDGAITSAISGAITAALAEGGDITTAISGAITTAISEGGSIETWGDGRYEPKASQE